MEKNKAITAIEDTFDKSFDKDKFTLFIKNLLNDIDSTKHAEYRGNLIKEAFRNHIAQYTRIGKYTDPNGVALDVLAIEVKDEAKLDKARTSLRNFVINHLKTFDKDYALAAFYSRTDAGRNWRFSFVKLEHTITVKEGKIKQQEELTPARRYSFLVGVDEKSHTAKRQLLPLLQNVYNNPLIEDLEKAFSIEVVTDEFFEQYKGLFSTLSEHFQRDEQLKTVLHSAETDIPRFTKKLLGQIVFLYFLQKKGWLGVPRDEKWGNGQKNFLQSLYQKSVDEGRNFFREYLQYLFYEALASQHGSDNYYKRFNCRIPFLNGGLFEADYDWKNFLIDIPNSLFRNNEKDKKTGDIGSGVLDVFDRYNFTIREDEPLEKEVAVDPEMLGKVFENMLEVTERKSKGAFYTPREIVHYMCQESLIHYLDNALNNENKIVPKEEIEDFVRKGIFTIENDIHVIGKGNETDTYKYKLPETIRNNADRIDELLTEIKICDPAIGSGAFPVGLLNELVKLQLVLSKHLSEVYFMNKLNIIGLNLKEYIAAPERYNYKIKRHSIQESIYGVDIDASAIDIARLRLWLSLVVDEEDFDTIEALPNLDYKIVCGNSLIGLSETAMYDWTLGKEQEAMKDIFFAENDEKKKKELRIAINKKLRELLCSAETFSGYKIDFDFKLYFSEVWREKGGFDIVIGNPPWLALIGKQLQKYKKVDESKNLKIYSEQYIFNSYMPNLYEFFLQKGFKITRKGGILSFIIPDRFGQNESNKELRKYFIDNSTVIEIVYKWDFPNIIADTMTFMCKNYKSKENYSFVVGNDSNTSMMRFDLSEVKNDEELMFRSFDSEQTKKNIYYIKNKSEILVKYAKSTSGFGAVAGTITKDRQNNRQQNILKGASIAPFIIRELYFFEFRPENLSGRTRDIEKLSIRNKVLVRKTGYPLICSFDDTGTYPEQSLYFFYELNNISNEYLLILFNSSIYNWFYKNYLVTNLESTPQLKNKDLDKFPIILLDEKGNRVIEIIAKFLLLLAKTDQNTKSYLFFKEVSDCCIFEIFFSEEIHASNKDVIKHLHSIKSIDVDMTDEEKLAVINSEFERLYDPYHPVRNNVETIESVEVVRIIKNTLQK